MNKKHSLKIGIACYPSVGGSGIVATTLGTQLAQRGHEVHFISYERPFRLPADQPNIYFHPVVINDYNLFKYPDYTLPLSVKMAEVSRMHDLDIMHVHYAVPHATAAILARCMLLAEGKSHPKVITTLHGTDTTLLGADPGYGPAIHHALAHSDVVTAVSQFLENETRRVLGFNGNIEVIHNFFEPGRTTRLRADVRKELGIRDDEIARARFLNGELKLHEGGNVYVNLPQMSFTKAQISPARDNRLLWMQSILHCTHYIAGAGEQGYLRKEEAPEIQFVTRDEIERSDEAYTELN